MNLVFKYLMDNGINPYLRIKWIDDANGRINLTKRDTVTLASVESRKKLIICDVRKLEEKKE
jgi:hypothetical protein